MRPSSIQPQSNTNRADWRTIRTLIPYLMEFKWRVFAAMSMLILSKLANVSVPLVLKEIIDALGKDKALLMVPVFLIVGYYRCSSICTA
jgi:ABC-type multidrug transport system fused ATPase/permease subunit